ncbi:phosphotransferase enzyme family protein [Microbacterium rhizomatis]|uniref:Phosphotransferase n=1 Tax=Microbacterium rhizomatis TaxID=1631477 RepID=A0A5J5J020_9MICO|nr:phosphotransferase [Microbacterium rhizomatis]KAA9105531.1 phosphotransferase [Microbacterium rhizomatis]
MTTASPTASRTVTHALAAFDSLQRGVAAPDWIVDGIRSSWLPTEPALNVELIAVSENATFRVSRAGVPALVVRVHRPGYVGDLDNVRSELMWVESLRSETDIRTPAPVRGVDGELVQSFPGAGETAWTAVAFEFVSGRILEDQVDLSHFVEIGRLTATLHRHARAWTAPAGFRRFEWDLRDMVGVDARWGDWRAAELSPQEVRTLERAEASARGVLAGMGRDRGDWGLIHSDLRPSNIMIESGELTVIDFDDCGYSWFLYDFASALTFYEHTTYAPEMAGNWLEGYRSVAPLTAQDLQRAAALSVIRRLTMLGWATTHREDALPADLWAQNIPGSVTVAERYLADPSWLVGAG